MHFSYTINFLLLSLVTTSLAGPVPRGLPLAARDALNTRPTVQSTQAEKRQGLSDLIIFLGAAVDDVVGSLAGKREPVPEPARAEKRKFYSDRLVGDAVGDVADVAQNVAGNFEKGDLGALVSDAAVNGVTTAADAIGRILAKHKPLTEPAGALKRRSARAKKPHHVNVKTAEGDIIGVAGDAVDIGGGVVNDAVESSTKNVLDNVLGGGILA